MAQFNAVAVAFVGIIFHADLSSLGNQHIGDGPLDIHVVVGKQQVFLVSVEATFVLVDSKRNVHEMTLVRADVYIRCVNEF